MANIAIHGFGRIGRSLMKVALKHGLFVPVSISDIKDISTLAALFEVDSNYGRWTEDVRVNDSRFVIGGREIPYFVREGPAELGCAQRRCRNHCTDGPPPVQARRPISMPGPSACW